MSKAEPHDGEDIKIAAIAVEDEYILSLVATGLADPGPGGAWPTFQYDRFSAPQRMNRYDNRYIKLREEGDFTSVVLVPFATDFLAEVARPPKVLGISTHGRVVVDRDIIIHEPTRGPSAGKGPITVDLKSLRKPGRDTVIVAQNDATAAALGESLWGAFSKYHIKEHHAFAYVWVGRGINAGIVIDGEPWQGRLHPEIGHIVPRRYSDEHGYVTDRYPGYCPQHGDCITGLAGYRTFVERVEKHGRPAEEALDMIAYYVAQLCAAVTLTVVPAYIAIGGLTVRQHPEVIERVRAHYPDMVRGFPGYGDQLSAQRVIIPAKLGDAAALMGILEIARRAILPHHLLMD